MHVTENSLKNNPAMVEKQLKNTHVTYMFLRHILNDLNFISKLEASEKPWLYFMGLFRLWKLACP
jgi:hypothetical protein